MRPIDAPFFPYPGGKARQRRNIARFLPSSGCVYVEPFAGRGNVFFMALRTCSFQAWHLNDIRSVPFFEALLAYDGHELPCATKDGVAALSPADKLLLGPIIYWAGGWATPTGNRGHDLGAYRERLLRARDDLGRATLTARDACELIERYAGEEDAFLYIDPPYIDGKVAAYSSTDVNHPRMYAALRGARCRFLLSEYRNPLTVEALDDPDVTYRAVNNPVPGEPSVEKEECLWGNYPLLPRVIDFGDVQPPMKVARTLLAATGALTRAQFNAACPQHWDERTTKKYQFDRLTTMPDVWYDGVTARIVG